MPSQIASIAIGTEGIDCVYHFALYELMVAIREADLKDAGEMLRIMVKGKQLRDISDLPLDLASCLNANVDFKASTLKQPLPDYLYFAAHSASGYL